MTTVLALPVALALYHAARRERSRAVVDGVVIGVGGLAMSFTVPRMFVATSRRMIARETPPATTPRKPSGPAQIYPAGDTGKLDNFGIMAATARGLFELIEGESEIGRLAAPG